MNTDHEDQFIHRIRKALARQTVGGRHGRNIFSSDEGTGRATNLLERIKNRTRTARMDLLDRLIEEGRQISLNVIPFEDHLLVGRAIAELVQRKAPEWGTEKRVVAWKHPLIAGLNLPQVLEKQGVPVFYTESEEAEENEQGKQSWRKTLRKQIMDSYVGVTSADFCVAESATLVMKTRVGQPRSVSLVPSIHIAVIRLEQIIADLTELYTLLKWDPAEKAEGLTNCMTFITGPSKTADIEATLVYGAHGPREVFIYVITKSLSKNPVA